MNRFVFFSNYAVFERKDILTHVITLMSLEDIILSEISQLQKGRYPMIPFTEAGRDLA